MTISRFYIALSSVALLQASSLVAFAESSYEQVDTVAEELAEVNVVGLKQDAKLRADAVSATVIGRSELEELNTVTLKGISDVVPNLYMPDYGSRITSSIYVRGLGARMDHPAVGLNVDNVPYLNKNAYDFDVADIAVVEMLRGPQSALYGRNTMGGLINVQTLSPMRWQGLRLMAETGVGNEYKYSAGWYHRFNDKLANSINLNYSTLGGFFTNSFNNKNVDHEKSGSARIKTQWRISDRVYVQNVIAASLLRQGGYPYEGYEDGVIGYNDPCFYRRFTINDGLTVNYRGKGWDMVSITTVQHINDNMTLDQDFTPSPYFTITQKQKETGLTEDLVFKGSRSDDNYKWLTGVFGFYKDMKMLAPVTFKEDGIANLIMSHRNDANPEYPITWKTDEFVLNSDFRIPTFGVAVYHESKYKLDNWCFTAGLRLDFEQALLDYRSYCSTGYYINHILSNGDIELFTPIDIDIDDKGKLKRRYFTWMPKVSVLYNLPGALGNVYATVTKGYKSGGFNTQMFSEVLQQKLMRIMGIGKEYDVNAVVGYKPEYSWNYEIGSHLAFADNKFTTDISLFYIDCRDQQLTMFPPGTTTGRLMTNAGKTRSFGGEVSVAYMPSDKWQINGSYGYTNAKFREFFNGVDNFKGKVIPYAPQNTVFLQALFNCPCKPLADFGGKFVFDVNMKGTGKIYWNESNTRWQNFYAQLGASVALETNGWSAQIWGKNLTNTKYYTFYFLSMGNEFRQRGLPYQFGVTIRYNFEL
ncbi:MAG: TonB-dependent receptor [Muribaculaceae bacterium]|nr:TonB-dependent receptor [Muribaculaceae bacterium]